ncbi:MAG: hypothetical protein IJ859_01610 [Synergistaceae bacterium]|nr:hypothetical protein [Synergistaceae bacterium]MBR2207485.1 hypothetical protein [Synergistaceae bacterium]
MNSNILPEVFNELRNFPQWVAFELRPKQDRPGEFSKIPINPRTGKGAMANNPATWGTFEEAKTYAERNGLFEISADGRQRGGIGFEFANGYAGIDLDHVVLSDGTLKPFAREIVRIMNSYTEYSPSGTGLHILFKIDGTPDEWKLFLGGKLGVKVGDVEFYTGAHYFTVTGKPYGEVKTLENRSEQAREVYRKYLIKSEPKNTNLSPQLSPSSKFQSDLSDTELLEKIFNSKNGSEVKALFDGDTSRHGGDESAADLALCNHLAFWTKGDAVRMDNLFRQSRLMREKWDRPTGGSTYGAITINKAIQSMRNAYTGKQSFNFVPSEYPQQEATEIEIMQQNIVQWTPPLTGYDYVNSGEYGADLENFRKFPEIYTGFENLDSKQGKLGPGLYALGAVPSLGKTTFCLQMANNFAKAGNFVLYYALEQTRFELTTKSISQITAKLEEQSGVNLSATKKAISSINIQRGDFHGKGQEEIYKKAVDEYNKFSNNIAIVSLGLNATIGNIKEHIEDFINNTGLRPIVFIDYLQIIRPENSRMNAKDYVDEHVRILKNLQSDKGLILILICSFNRANYASPVDYESFKETGAIEYTADVLWGMQLQIIGRSNTFAKDDKAKNVKRKEIDAAYRENPRSVMLVNLKNRYGKKSYSCGFNYHCAYDYFVIDPLFNDDKKTDEQRAVY